ncbi:MAG: hypothetical protein RR382_00055 [Tannerellaceae bacterium]
MLNRLSKSNAISAGHSLDGKMDLGAYVNQSRIDIPDDPEDHELNTPQLEGQFAKDMYKLGESVCATFNLNVQTDLDAYNAIVSGASRKEPSHLVSFSREEFYQGAFFVMLVYRTVDYDDVIGKIARSNRGNVTSQKAVLEARKNKRNNKQKPQ